MIGGGYGLFLGTKELEVGPGGQPIFQAMIPKLFQGNKSQWRKFQKQNPAAAQQMVQQHQANQMAARNKQAALQSVYGDLAAYEDAAGARAQSRAGALESYDQRVAQNVLGRQQREGMLRTNQFGQRGTYAERQRAQLGSSIDLADLQAKQQITGRLQNLFASQNVRPPQNTLPATYGRLGQSGARYA